VTVSRPECTTYGLQTNA